MQDNQYIRASFTLFISKLITNTAINYKKKLKRLNEREAKYNDDFQQFFNHELFDIQEFESLTEYINYKELEKIFTNSNHSKAMKKLSDREKLVLYLSGIEELSNKNIARILNTTEGNVKYIKHMAKSKFLRNL